MTDFKARRPCDDSTGENKSRQICKTGGMTSRAELAVPATPTRGGGAPPAPRSSLALVRVTESKGSLKVILHRSNGAQSPPSSPFEPERAVSRSDLCIGLRVRLRSSYSIKKRDFVCGPGKVIRSDDDGWATVLFDSGASHMYRIRHLVHETLEPSSLPPRAHTPARKRAAPAAASASSSSRDRASGAAAWACPKCTFSGHAPDAPRCGVCGHAQPKPRSPFSALLGKRKPAPLFAKAKAVRAARAGEKEPRAGVRPTIKLAPLLAIRSKRAKPAKPEQPMQFKPFSNLPKASIFMTPKEKRAAARRAAEQALKADIEDSRDLCARLSVGKKEHWFLQPRKLAPGISAAPRRKTTAPRKNVQVVLWPCPFPTDSHVIPSDSERLIVEGKALQAASGEPLRSVWRASGEKSVSGGVGEPELAADVWFTVEKGVAVASNGNGGQSAGGQGAGVHEECKEREKDPQMSRVSPKDLKKLYASDAYRALVQSLARSIGVDAVDADASVRAALAARIRQQGHGSSMLLAEAAAPGCDALSRSSPVVASIRSWLSDNWVPRGDQPERNGGAGDSSDEFESDGEAWTPPRTSQSLLLYGEPSVGKTSAVYECCRELGFTVLEINTSQRRSGADITRVCREATQSHLLCVTKKKNPFGALTRRRQKVNAGSAKSRATTSSEHQTLILIDEVDNVFAPDAGFFKALSVLLRETKRPIVLTCNQPPRETDALESLMRYEMLRVPAKAAALHAVSATLAQAGIPKGSTVAKVVADIGAVLVLNDRDMRRALSTVHMWVCSEPIERVVRSLSNYASANSGDANIDADTTDRDADDDSFTVDLHTMRGQLWEKAAKGSVPRAGPGSWLHMRALGISDDSKGLASGDGGCLMAQAVHADVPLLHLNYLEHARAALSRVGMEAAVGLFQPPLRFSTWFEQGNADQSESKQMRTSHGEGACATSAAPASEIDGRVAVQESPLERKSSGVGLVQDDDNRMDSDSDATEDLSDDEPQQAASHKNEATAASPGEASAPATPDDSTDDSSCIVDTLRADIAQTQQSLGCGAAPGAAERGVAMDCEPKASSDGPVRARPEPLTAEERSAARHGAEAARVMSSIADAISAMDTWPLSHIRSELDATPQQARPSTPAFIADPSPEDLILQEVLAPLARSPDLCDSEYWLGTDIAAGIAAAAASALDKQTRDVAERICASRVAPDGTVHGDVAPPGRTRPLWCIDYTDERGDKTLAGSLNRVRSALQRRGRSSLLLSERGFGESTLSPLKQLCAAMLSQHESRRHRMRLSRRRHRRTARDFVRDMLGVDPAERALQKLAYHIDPFE